MNGQFYWFSYIFFGVGLVSKLCPTLVTPGSSVHGISQARKLDLVVISFSRGCSQPRDQTHVSWIAGRFFTAEPPGQLHIFLRLTQKKIHCFKMIIFFYPSVQTLLKTSSVWGTHFCLFICFDNWQFYFTYYPSDSLWSKKETWWLSVTFFIKPYNTWH